MILVINNIETQHFEVWRRAFDTDSQDLFSDLDYFQTPKPQFTYYVLWTSRLDRMWGPTNEGNKNSIPIIQDPCEFWGCLSQLPQGPAQDHD